MWQKINHESDKDPWRLDREYRLKVDFGGTETVLFAHRIDRQNLYVFQSFETHNSPVLERIVMHDTKHVLATRQSTGASNRVIAIHYRE